MSILVTCDGCNADNRVEAVHMIVRFSDSCEERAAELLFTCGSCGGIPVQRVPRELAAVVVLRGAASLTVPDLPPAAVTGPARTSDTPALRLDDLLELPLQPLDSDRVRSFLDDPDPDGC